MQNVIPLALNFSFQWTWLGRLISSTYPNTVHVFCLEICAPNALFETFVYNSTPWTSLYNESELLRSRDGDAILMLSDTSEATTRAIARIGTVPDAFRARYFLVLKNNVTVKVIENLVKSAWANQLAQVLAVRLKDKTMYAVRPKCGKPRIFQVSTVRWPNLKKTDLSGCSLKIAADNMPMSSAFDGEDDSTLSGYYKPMYQHLKAALKFKGVLIQTSFANISTKLIKKQVDMSFRPYSLAPNIPIEMTTLYTTKMSWCVPDSCVLGSTTYFLWHEFAASSWALLAASVLAVVLSVWRFAPSGTSTLLDSLLTIMSTLASTAVKLPQGHARWIVTGWVLSMLVLSTAYQTFLHSMMTAPLIVQKIDDDHGLLKSEISLICPPHACKLLGETAKKDTVLARLAARTKEMHSSIANAFVSTHQKTHAIYVSDISCQAHFEKMRPLLGGRAVPTYMGLFGVLPSSWLAPVLRQVGLQAEASGLLSRFLYPRARKLSCSSPENGDLQPITLALLWPAILLLCCGLSFALTAFITEISLFWLKTKKRKR